MHNPSIMWITKIPTYLQGLLPTYKVYYRVFSHDVTAAILVSQNNEAAAVLVSQTSLRELNSFLMQTQSFVPINLHIYWPRE